MRAARYAGLALLLAGAPVLGAQTPAPSNPPARPPTPSPPSTPLPADTTTAVLLLRETDDDNRVHVVQAGGVVDINSAIRIDLDAASLRASAARLAPGDTALDRRIETMAALQRVSSAGLNALDEASTALAAWASAPGTQSGENAVETAMRPVSRAMDDLVALAPRGSPLRTQLNAALRSIPAGAPITDRLRAQMEVAAAEARRLQAEVDQVLARRGTVVLLGAWLMTNGENRPIHLAGFDSIPPGEFYEVPRYQVVLSQADLDQLKQMQADATRMRETGVAVQDVLRQQLQTALGGIPNRVNQCVTGLRGALTAVAPQESALRQQLAPAATLLEQWATLVQSLRDAFGPDAGGDDPAAFLAGVNTNVATLQQLAAQTEPVLRQVGAAVQPIATDAANALRSQLQTCQPVLTDAGKVVATARGLAGLFSAANDVNTASLEFSSKIIRRDIGSIAEGTRFSLKETGRREAGDHVVVRLALASGSGKPQTVDERQFQVDRVIPYVYTAAAFIFADPLAGTAVEGRFQPAASYSILYSVGSRRSPGYNRLLRFSAGLNIAALDFNKDDTPEMGVAAVVTGLVDLFKVGLGYNIQADAPYWFFGLRLPTGTFPIGTP